MVVKRGLDTTRCRGDIVAAPLEALARRTMKLQFTLQEGHVLATSDDRSDSFDLEGLRDGG